MAQVSGPLSIRMNWLQPCPCGHLESEPADPRSLHLSLSPLHCHTGFLVNELINRNATHCYAVWIFSHLSVYDSSVYFSSFSLFLIFFNLLVWKADTRRALLPTGLLAKSRNTLRWANPETGGWNTMSSRRFPMWLGGIQLPECCLPGHTLSERQNPKHDWTQTQRHTNHIQCQAHFITFKIQCHDKHTSMPLYTHVCSYKWSFKCRKQTSWK